MTSRILSTALREITEAAEYYTARETGLGADFILEMEAALERIRSFPEAWSHIAPGYRHCNLQRFPYTVIYRFHADAGILIVSVFHHSRAPLSWRTSLPGE